MSISFETAVSSLKIMFPDWDEETLSTLLVANNYHVERTIETVLNMSGDVAESPPSDADPFAAPSSTANQAFAAVPAPAPSSAPVPSPSRPTPAPQTRPFSAPSSTQRRYRGIKCELPDDFLRPPGWETTIIADEELALMLQNELFQREVRAMLGDDFMNAGSLPPTQRMASGTQLGGHPSSAAGAGTNNTDLGIMKALASMGSATKRNLSGLAQRFSSQPTRRPSESGTSREFRPLVESNHEQEDEDETEVISFDSRGTRSTHVLQSNMDSENPLLAGNTRAV